MATSLACSEQYRHQDTSLIFCERNFQLVVFNGAFSFSSDYLGRPALRHCVVEYAYMLHSEGSNDARATPETSCVVIALRYYCSALLNARHRRAHSYDLHPYHGKHFCQIGHLMNNYANNNNGIQQWSSQIMTRDQTRTITQSPSRRWQHASRVRYADSYR